MKKHNFRFSKVRQLRQQQERLAAADTARLKLHLDQAVARLRCLENRLLELTSDFERTMKEQPTLIDHVYRAIELLHNQIADAQTDVTQCEQSWNNAREAFSQKKIESEKMSQLYRRDLQLHNEQTAKFHSAEMHENIMRQWIEKNRETDA